MKTPRLLAIAALAVFTAGCASSAETPTTARPTNPAVFERINSLTDCAALQAEFDQAEENGMTSYMRAAHDRMGAVGCY